MNRPGQWPSVFDSLITLRGRRHETGFNRDSCPEPGRYAGTDGAERPGPERRDVPGVQLLRAGGDELRDFRGPVRGGEDQHGGAAHLMFAVDLRAAEREVTIGVLGDAMAIFRGRSTGWS